MIDQLFQVIKFIVYTYRKANGGILNKVNLYLIFMKQAKDLTYIFFQDKREIKGGEGDQYLILFNYKTWDLRKSGLPFSHCRPGICRMQKGLDVQRNLLSLQWLKRLGMDDRSSVKRKFNGFFVGYMLQQLRIFKNPGIGI